LGPSRKQEPLQIDVNGWRPAALNATTSGMDEACPIERFWSIGDAPRHMR
jgi:hypothetical protein